MMEPPRFDMDLETLGDAYKNNLISICWYCKNRHRCPLNWRCETLANLDNDNTNNGDDEA